jgi:hypothetical protein
MKMLVLIVILFIVPLELHFFEAIQPFPATNYFDIWFISVLLEYSDGPTRDGPSLIYSNPLTIYSAIAICIPAVLLNRRIRNQDSSRSILDIGLASLFGTAVIAVFLVEYFPPGELAWLIQIDSESKLLRFATLVTIVLIVLPVIIRETSYQAFQRRHRILAGIIGLVAALVPVMIISSFPYNWANYQSISLTYNLSYEFTVPPVPWQPIDRIFIDYRVLDIMNLFNGFVYFGLHLAFGFAIFRYLQGLTSRFKALLLGAAGFFGPYGYTTYGILASDTQTLTAVIPIPILFLLGIIVLAVSHQIPIEPDPEFDESRELTRDLAEAKDSISVPVLYVLKSKLLGVKNRFQRRKDES